MEKENTEELKKRVDGFKSEYKELTDKYQLDFTAYPQFTQQEDGTFCVVAPITIIDRVALKKNTDEFTAKAA